MQANHQAFVRVVATLARHEGRYALMRSGMIVEFYEDRYSAMLAGNEQFADAIYSIHRVRVAALRSQAA